jgi:RES domain-containing protein
MIRAFRLCKTRHMAAAFTGEGARLNGGRWNSPGKAVVYTASSLSLATLEVLVHLEDPEVFGKLFSWVSLEIPPDLVETQKPASLPFGWNDDESSRISRAIGETWLGSMRSAVLAVPSVVTPGEWNYLLNPAHPDFPQILIDTPQPFRPDPRLLR